MKLNRTKIGSIVVAMVAAMTVLVMTGCGYGVAGGPPGEWVTIFDLAEDEVFQALPFGPISDSNIADFSGSPFVNAGATLAIVPHPDNPTRRALEVSSAADGWRGIDLPMERVDFQVGDEISIAGVAVTASQPTFNVNVAAWAAFQDWNPQIAAGATFENTFDPLTAAHVAAIRNNTAHDAPSPLRFVQAEPNRTVIITDLLIEGYREGWAPAPLVAIGTQAGDTLVPGEAGVVTFEVSASNLEIPLAWFGTANTRTIDFEDSPYVTVTGLPTGVTASGSITLNRSGDSAGDENILTLTVADGADTVTGTSTLSIYMFEVTGLGGLVVGPGRYITVSGQAGVLMPEEPGNLLFIVTASNLDVTNAVVEFRTAGVVGNLPVGVTASGSINIDAAGNGQGMLALSGSNDTEAGRSLVTITIGRAVSEAFNLTIGNAIVDVAAQVGSVTSGTAGTVSFEVSATGLAPGTINFATAGVVYGLPAGVTASGTIVINAAGAGTGMLTLNVAATAATGFFPLTVTLSDIESDSFTLTVFGEVFSLAAFITATNPTGDGGPVMNAGATLSFPDSGGMNVGIAEGGDWRGVDIRHAQAGSDWFVLRDVANFVYTVRVVGTGPADAEILVQGHTGPHTWAGGPHTIGAAGTFDHTFTLPVEFADNNQFIRICRVEADFHLSDVVVTRTARR